MSIVRSVPFALVASALAAAPIRVPVPEPSEELGTMPPAEYVTDYHPLPIDALPARAIQEYNPSVRVPEYHWMECEGANALALRIRPITLEELRKEVSVGLIDTNRNKTALLFTKEAEADAGNRRVEIRNLDLPSGEFTGLKYSCVTPNAADLRSGVRTKGDRIDAVWFEVPENSGVFEIIDLRLERKAAKARFTDLPARRWTRRESVFGKSGPLLASDCIADVVKFVRSDPGAESIAALADSYELRPQLEKESDGGFEVAFTDAVVQGKKTRAVRITLRRGPRCLLRFPLAFDGLDYSTFTFVAKVEAFEGAKPVLGDAKPMLWGTNQHELNRPFDTFQISFFSRTHDFCDWTRWGLAQADFRQNAYPESELSKDGWRAFAYDIANSDPSNNKSSFYTRLTHWCFYYDNRKIPDGKEVVITIADPRITRGLMHSGGDLGKYKTFLKGHDANRMVDLAALETALEPPKTNRLARPIPLIAGRRPVGSVVFLKPDLQWGASREEWTAYGGIVRDAVDAFTGILERKFGLAARMPVLDRLPRGGTAALTNAVVVGGSAYAEIDRKTYDADMKRLEGTPGVAIRSDGRNIYIYAPRYNYAGNARALSFGLYELLENNTDVIWHHRGAVEFEQDPSGEFSLVWGDGFVHAPPFAESDMGGAGGVNRVPGFDWVGSWGNGRRRTRSVNHWWGYGTEPRGDEKKDVPNETWGRRADGSYMKPGCYTGHPCLVRVLDRARESYLESSVFRRIDRGPFAETRPHGDAYAWNSFDVHGLWVEDSISLCQCEKCLMPIRLADGSTVGPDSPAFRSTQFYSNGSAMINAVNVFGNRDARIESIGYFWMAPVPLINVSRSYDIRFCPYIRKNYFVPIYAPMNDMHWRAMYRWAQQDVGLSMYEYFLFVNARPWADVARFDLVAEAELGFGDWHAESARDDSDILSRMDQWVMERLLWGGVDQDVPSLRAYYIARVYRDAAKPVAEFYQGIMSLASATLSTASPMEFEDESPVVRTAMRAKAGWFGARTEADRLEGCIREAERVVRDSNAVAEVALLRRAWDAYRAKAERDEAKWQEDVRGGCAAKEMKVLGAPE